MTLIDTQRLMGVAKSLLRQHDYDMGAHATLPVAATYAASGTVVTASWVVIGSATPVIDQGGMYDTSTLTFTIKTPGLYECSGSVYWDARPAPANHLLLTVYKGINEIGRWSAPGAVAAASQGSSGCIYLDLAAGDQIQFKVYQDCGSSATAKHMVTCVKFVRPTS